MSVLSFFHFFIKFFSSEHHRSYFHAFNFNHRQLILYTHYLKIKQSKKYYAWNNFNYVLNDSMLTWW